MRRKGVISVVVVDDDARVLHDFGQLIALEPELSLVGTAGDGVTAVTLCERLKPDVIAMDVRMPHMNGIEATRRLRTGGREECRVLVTTTFDLDEYVLGAVRAGASGFLLKDQAADDLAPALRTVAAGDAIVSPRATGRLLRELVRPQAAPPLDDEGLTDREIEVVRLMARGLSNADIAATAYISPTTVKTHVSHILSKLGLSSRLQVVVWAYETGLARPSASRR